MGEEILKENNNFEDFEHLLHFDFLIWSTSLQSQESKIDLLSINKQLE